MMHISIRFVFVLLAGLLLLAACTRTTRIQEIQEHPRDYAGKQVVIEGEVREVFSLIVFKYFSLDDGSGSITVLTDKALPRKGERLKVVGRVEEAFSLGDQSLTVVVESKEDKIDSPRP